MTIERGQETTKKRIQHRNNWMYAIFYKLGYKLVRYVFQMTNLGGIFQLSIMCRLASFINSMRVLTS